MEIRVGSAAAGCWLVVLVVVAMLAVAVIEEITFPNTHTHEQEEGGRLLVLVLVEVVVGHARGKACMDEKEEGKTPQRRSIA